MIEQHECQMIKVGAGIPIVLAEHIKFEKFLAKVKRSPSLIQNYIRKTILQECSENCQEGEHVMFCPECWSVQRVE